MDAPAHPSATDGRVSGLVLNDIVDDRYRYLANMGKRWREMTSISSIINVNWAGVCTYGKK